MVPSFKPLVASPTTSSRARNTKRLAVLIRTRVSAGTRMAAVSALILPLDKLVSNTLAQITATLVMRQLSTPTAIASLRFKYLHATLNSVPGTCGQLHVEFDPQPPLTIFLVHFCQWSTARLQLLMKPTLLLLDVNRARCARALSSPSALSCRLRLK